MTHPTNSAAVVADLDKLPRYDICFDEDSDFIAPNPIGNYFKAEDVRELLARSAAPAPAPVEHHEMLASGLREILASAKGNRQWYIADLARECMKQIGMSDAAPAVEPSAEKVADAENLALVIARLEQIAGNFSDDYREAAEQALVCARAIAASRRTAPAVISDERLAELFEESISYPLESDDLAGVRLFAKLIAREVLAAAVSAGQAGNCDCCKDIRAAEAIHGDGPEGAGQAGQVAMLVPHEMGYPTPASYAGSAYTNGWNDCRATMLGEIPDDPTNCPATESAAAPADQKGCE